MDRRKFLKALGIGVAALPFVKMKPVEAETSVENIKAEKVEAHIPLPDHKIKICFDEPEGNPFFSHYELWCSENDMNYFLYGTYENNFIGLVPDFQYRKVYSVDNRGMMKLGIKWKLL